MVKLPTKTAAPLAPHHPKDLETIKRTLAADLTMQEFDYFIALCRHEGVDPFKRQISPIVFYKNDPEKRNVQYHTTIDGLRARAARSGVYLPSEKPVEFEYSTDELDSPTNPAGLILARCYVKRYSHGEWHEIVGEARWHEYAPLYSKSGKQHLKGGKWADAPRLMLGKCAEAQALRRAFPDELAGLYGREEVDVIDAAPASDALREAKAEIPQEQNYPLIFGLQPDMVREGELVDKVLAHVRDCETLEDLERFTTVNAAPLRWFWGRQPNDALGIKDALDRRRAELSTQHSLGQSPRDDTKSNPDKKSHGAGNPRASIRVDGDDTTYLDGA